jgi:hypothetical protein
MGTIYKYMLNIAKEDKALTCRHCNLKLPIGMPYLVFTAITNNAKTQYKDVITHKINTLICFACLKRFVDVIQEKLDKEEIDFKDFEIDSLLNLL